MKQKLLNHTFTTAFFVVGIILTCLSLVPMWFLLGVIPMYVAELIPISLGVYISNKKMKDESSAKVDAIGKEAKALFQNIDKTFQDYNVRISKLESDKRYQTFVDPRI